MFEDERINTKETRTEYRDAFQRLWDNVLTKLPNEPKDIAASLERQFVLRRFNKERLGIEISSGSPLNKLVGVGTRLDPNTSRQESVFNFYPSYLNQVIETFKTYPITQFFGLTPQTAMELPVDQWYAIRKAAESLPPIQHKTYDNEAELIKLLRDILTTKGGDT